MIQRHWLDSNGSILHHVKVNVPLIGGAVEKYVLGQTEQGCSEELDYLADFVKQNR